MAARSTPYTLPSLPTSDPAAAVAGVIVSVLGALGLAEKWGISPDDVLVVVGAVATLAAAIRSWYHRRLQTTQASIAAPTAFMADDPTHPTDVRTPGGES